MTSLAPMFVGNGFDSDPITEFTGNFFGVWFSGKIQRLAERDRNAVVEGFTAT
jgi:hypothetical protein